jgi:DNA polymerase III alpha subunit (gram-positive type)
MSISAMKQALEALETDPCKENAINNAQFFIKKAIAEAEKTIYVDSSRFPKDQLDHKPGMVITEPVHASDMFEKHVHKSDKDRHELAEQPDLARVGEVGVWGKEKNT